MSKKFISKNLQPEFHNQLDLNEIKIIKRTLDNNTHLVLEDTKLKRITSWRKSEIKFKKNLIFNILSFGILHIISLIYPNIYIITNIFFYKFLIKGISIFIFFTYSFT